MEQLAQKVPAPLSWIIPDPYDPSSYMMPMAVIGKKPLSKFAKQYAKLVKLGEREVWQFPGKYATPEAGRAIGIPKNIRISQGVAPTTEILEQLQKAYQASKSELGYTGVQDLVDLTGLPRETVHNTIIKLVREGKAILNVDRWGNATYVKFK
jgi:hypothetical protein